MCTSHFATQNVKKMCIHETKLNKINFYNFIRIFLGESDFVVVIVLS